MAIVIDENIVAMFFVEGPGRDFLAAVHWEGENLGITWRFRYHRSPDPADRGHLDEKSWYHATAPKAAGEDRRLAEKYAIDSVHTLTDGLHLMGFGSPVVHEIVRGDMSVDDFTRAWMAQMKRFTHVDVEEPKK